MKAGILALDLSSATGWVYGQPGALQASGLWKLPPVIEPGRTFNALAGALADALATFQPEVVVMEAPLNLAAQTRHDTAYQQFGLAAITDTMADRYETPIYAVSVQNARRKVLGTARGWEKPAIVAWVQANGFPAVENHNIADAIVVWLYACATWKPRRRIAA